MILLYYVNYNIIKLKSMINYIIAAFFGIVQGITEFLPVSSSGHLVLMHNFFDIPISNELVFDVTLHFATLLAVMYFFRKDIIILIKNWIKSIVKKDFSKGKTAWFIILATIPAGLAGVLLEDYIESVFRSLLVVAIMLIAVGILFIVIERMAKQKDKIENMNWKNAFIIGLAQALALIPGTSRSGITILAGLNIGLKRKEAIKFSFLLSIPIILGAFITKVPDLINSNLQSDEYMLLAISFVFSYLAGFFAIKYFLKIAEKYTLNMFAYYRFALATIVLVFYFFTK